MGKRKRSFKSSAGLFSVLRRLSESPKNLNRRGFERGTPVAMQDFLTRWFQDFKDCSGTSAGLRGDV